MNKFKTFVCILMLLCGQTSQAQEREVTFYYNELFYVCQKASAKYYRVVSLDSEVSPYFIVEDYYMSDSLYRQSLMSHVDPVSQYYDVQEGNGTWYYESGIKEKQASFVNGKLVDLCRTWTTEGAIKDSIYYSNGKPDGESVVFFSNGKIRTTCVYAKGQKNGLLKRYWPSGQLRREEMYHSDVMDWGKCYDSTGHEIPYFIADAPPEYPGGEDEMMAFLGRNIHYPPMARDNDIQGQVIIQFVVNTDGRLSNYKVVRPVSPILEAEALRVVKLMPNWKPGKEEGEWSNIIYNLPIHFTVDR